MKKDETAANRLAARAREVRLQREAAEARAAANRKARRRARLTALVAAPVGFLGLCVALALTVPSPTPTPAPGPDWRAKVGQATPAELAAQPPVAPSRPRTDKEQAELEGSLWRCSELHDKADCEFVKKAAENPVAEAKPEVKPEADPVGDWAVRAYEAQQAHQDRCWDQLEERGYGDASCY